jgi:2-methylisocitrate lyase-like PEP mutase family enzyme
VSAGARLRALLRPGACLWLPSVHDPLTARLVEAAGFEAGYVGGYVTGAARAVGEPLLTLTEQVETAAAAARAVAIPVLADAGAGFGEPLHVMRTVREFVAAGIAGIHIEDQVFPKRAHYHKYQVHAVPVTEFADRIRYACRARDAADHDFVVIARTDTCRELGLAAAVPRLDAAADAGADLGLLFPRSAEEAAAAPRACKLPLVYVQSRGNRDGRPLFRRSELAAMGYVACIDAQVVLLTGMIAQSRMLAALRTDGEVATPTEAEFVAARKAVEDLIGLEAAYAIEAETVERTR